MTILYGESGALRGWRVTRVGDLEEGFEAVHTRNTVCCGTRLRDDFEPERPTSLIFGVAGCGNF
jgi:hypothetical protein